MKIAVVQCPVWGIFEPPLGLSQISAYLRKIGHRVGVWDINIELYFERDNKHRDLWAMEQCEFWSQGKNIDEYFRRNKQISKYIDEIINFNPSLVLFSINSVAWLSSKKFLQLLKKRNKNIISLLGGPFFKRKNSIKAVLEEESVDYVIAGEGEITVGNFMEVLESGSDIRKVKGIYFKKNEQIVFTGEAPPLMDLDTLPFLDIYSFPLDKYDPPHDKTHIALMASRGCIWNCVFCSSRAYWSGYRSMSGRRIFEEVKHHITRLPGLNFLDFMDLVFNGNMRRVKEFCELMIKSGIKNSGWRANMVIRPEMSGNLLKKMYKAGFRSLTYGIESGSQRILNLMRKKYDISVAGDVLKHTHQAGITTRCNFMFGFPGETEEDFRETLKFVEMNGRYIDEIYPSWTYCGLEEESYLRRHYQQFGIKSGFSHSLYWETEDGINTYPVRRQRYERFIKYADSLGLNVCIDLGTNFELNKWYDLGCYYQARGEKIKALEAYKQYLKVEPENINVRNKLKVLEDSR